MRYLLLVASFLIAPLVSAQELHTFSNGGVADAEKINENFRLLLAEIEALQSRVEAIEVPPVGYSKSLGYALQPNGLTFAA